MKSSELKLFSERRVCKNVAFYNRLKPLDRILLGDKISLLNIETNQSNKMEKPWPGDGVFWFVLGKKHEIRNQSLVPEPNRIKPPSLAFVKLYMCDCQLSQKICRQHINYKAKILLLPKQHV